MHFDQRTQRAPRPVALEAFFRARGDASPDAEAPHSAAEDGERAVVGGRPLEVTAE